MTKVYHEGPEAAVQIASLAKQLEEAEAAITLFIEAGDDLVQCLKPCDDESGENEYAISRWKAIKERYHESGDCSN